VPVPTGSTPADPAATDPVASEPAPTSSAADGLAASVARLADEVVEQVTGMVKALLNADEGASKAVKELIEQVGDVVSALLGGNGASWSAEELIGRMANAVSKLAEAVGGVLGGLVGGEGAPTAPAYYYRLVAQPLSAFYYDYERVTAGLIERTAAATGELAQTVGEALSGGGVAPNQEARVPATPPAAPPLVPFAPLPVAPGSYSSSFLGASGSGAEAFQLLFALLVVFSVALWRGGRLSWLRRTSHGPPTAIVLAIERPG
jgi:hypothetical protein